MTENYGLSFPLDRVDWIAGISLEALREGRLRRAKQVLFEQNEFGAFLTLNEWNTRYITSTYTPLWTTGSSGLRYALLCRDADQPILYDQGDIGYHTKRFAPWLGDDNVKYAISRYGLDIPDHGSGRPRTAGRKVRGPNRRRPQEARGLQPRAGHGLL